jgi:hypothetical protein
MKLFNTMLIGILSLTGSFLNANEVPPADATRYDRIITVAKQNYVYTPASPLDPNHALMRSLGIFTEAEIDLLDAETLTEFYDQYGIDMSNSNPNVIFDPSTGVRVLPGVVTLLPSTLGTVADQNWVVVIDTKHPKRDYKWVHYHFANLAIFSKSFTVAAGTKAGATVKPGDIYFRGVFVHAKAGADPAIAKNCETFQTRSIKLTSQSNNMWNLIEYYLSYEIYDSYNNRGYVLSVTSEVNIPANGTGVPHVQGRHVMTWEHVPEIDEINEEDCA